MQIKQQKSNMDEIRRVPKTATAPKKVNAEKPQILHAKILHTKKSNQKLVIPKPTILDKASQKPFSLKGLIPMVAAFIVIAILIQSAAYLTDAKSVSGVVLGAATNAYGDLDAANKSLEERDFVAAKNKFSSAQVSLATAQTELDKFKLLTTVAPQAKSADQVLTGAFFLAEAGKNLTSAMQLFDELSVTSQGISTTNFTEKLQQNRNLLKNSLLLLSHAEDNFNSATNLPGDYQQTLDQAKTQIDLMNSVLKNLVDMEDLFLSFFGTKPRTYLLVFPNYDEIRATGGFIGTYGALKYENGSIRQLKIESVYNIDGSLSKQIAAPGPFQPYIQKWGLRDANWFVDFPTSAKKMLEFFEMESETADGVISVTPQLFVDILRLIGPVDMPDYDVTLTPENFQEVVQSKTSIEYDKKLNQPKKFLHDFAPIMLDRLSSLGKEQWFEVFQILKNNFEQKHILVYSTEQDTQDKIVNLGFDGKIKETEFDYLAVVNSNLGGTKTDLDIRQSIHVSSTLDKRGEIINVVTIKRENTSIENNRNFMRVMVPQGSKLLGSTGFADLPQHRSTADGFATDPLLAAWDHSEELGELKIRSEAGKTEFTGWVETPGMATSELTIRYTLPFKIKPGLFDRSKSYSLLYQKQPGYPQSPITGELNFSNFQVAWNSANSQTDNNVIKFNSSGKTDELWAAVVKN